MSKFSALEKAISVAVVPHREDPCELCGLPSGVTDNEECLGALLEQMRDIKTEYGDIFSRYAYLEGRAKENARVYSELTDTSGEILRIDGAKAKVTPPKKPRVYWNAKGLQEYSADHPDVLQFREEKWSKPSVRIEVT